MKLSPMERIEQRSTRDNSGCLVWGGILNRPNGYGSMYAWGKLRPTHRIAWESVNGPVPDGFVLDHLCHNRRCAEVTHLRLVTDAINKQNRAGPQANCKTGIRGVYRVASGKYKARVQVDGKQFSPPPFDSIEDAERAVIALRARLHQPVPAIE